MKISNLKVFKKMEKGKVRLCALSLAGMFAVFCLTGCTSKNEQQSYVEQQVMTQEFQPGEHIISVPIMDPTVAITQYTYHEGYKCVGIGSSSYGKYASNFGGACLLYVNEYPVICSGILNNNGEVSFTEFGSPIGYEKSIQEETEEYKIFDKGEHIISIKIDNPTRNRKTYPSFEGYEPIGIATTTYGQYGTSFGGACLLYTNTEPVRCKKIIDKNGNVSYICFGEVISKIKIK